MKKSNKPTRPGRKRTLPRRRRSRTNRPGLGGLAAIIIVIAAGLVFFEVPHANHPPTLQTGQTARHHHPTAGSSNRPGRSQAQGTHHTHTATPTPTPKTAGGPAWTTFVHIKAQTLPETGVPGAGAVLSFFRDVSAANWASAYGSTTPDLQQSMTLGRFQAAYSPFLHAAVVGLSLQSAGNFSRTFIVTLSRADGVKQTGTVNVDDTSGGSGPPDWQVQQATFDSTQ